MKCKASVTFEYMTRAPETHIMPSLEATGPQTIANRAIREAKKQIRPVWWTSLVVVLERLDSSESGAEDESAAAEDDAEN